MTAIRSLDIGGDVAKTDDRLGRLYRDPAFWKGAITTRQIGNGQHHDEAVTRLHQLLDMAEAKQDVMASPEFDRWLGYKGVPQRCSAQEN